MNQDDLFGGEASSSPVSGEPRPVGAAAANAPLAERMRPRHIDEFVGQTKLIGEDGPLRRLLLSGRIQSLVLWGPPGTGKTTFGRLVAAHLSAPFKQLSAVLAGVKDVRAVVDEAQREQLASERSTVLFVDEVHRFNKSQQDAFLPFVEDGTLVFVGATTENPSFELNNALLSRARVLVFEPLQERDIADLLRRALTDEERGYGHTELCLQDAAIDVLAKAADGDARRGLNLLELVLELALARECKTTVPDALVDEALDSANIRRFDKGGDLFYDLISALHKSIRGSSPDAALYWFARMLDGGCDPLYIARRLVRIASEDVGLADPRALGVTLEAWETYRRLGSPEGELAIAQALIHLACTEKSNAAYTAFNAAMEDAKSLGTLAVPMRLRNAPTAMMRDLGYAQNYRYAHQESDAYAAGEHYFPDELSPRRYYSPSSRGIEARYLQRLEKLQALDDAAAELERREPIDPKDP